MHGLNDELLTKVATILSNNNRVEEALLFGSRAKGNFRAGSDIDIALKGPNLVLNDILHLSIDLDALETPYQFDLVLYQRITEPALREHIDRVGHVLYQKVAAASPQ